MSVEQQISGEKALKVPKTVSLEKTTIKHGKALAQAENRNFSNLIDALVAREFQRRFPDEAAKEQLELLRENGKQVAA